MQLRVVHSDPVVVAAEAVGDPDLGVCRDERFALMISANP
jgi:hypothetical protein